VTRVALLTREAAAVAPLAVALRGGGCAVVVVSPPAPRAAEAVLRRRGFTGPLAHVPLALAELLRGRFDVAHAFSPPDALAARAWQARAGGPVVFTGTEVLGRETVADSRLRLRLLQDAVTRSDAVLASTPAVRDAMARWLAVDAPVLEPAEHAALYRKLISLRG